MRTEDFFIQIPSGSPWESPAWALDPELIEQVYEGRLVGVTDIEVAVPLARLLHNEFEEYATAQNANQLSASESIGAMSALRSVLRRLGIRFEPPFSGFAEFGTWWRREGLSGHGSWARRRQALSELFGPIHEQLADIEAGALTKVLAQPVGDQVRTGWTLVDEEVAEMRRHFQGAETAQDYRNVGNDAVIVLERLSEAAFDPDRHLPSGEVEPPVAQTKARLEMVVNAELPGRSSAELRKLVRAAIEQAQAVKHRTPDRLQAGVAADSVILLAAMLRRITSEGSASSVPAEDEPPF